MRDSFLKDTPFEVIGSDRPGPWLVVCDHATNRIPPDVNGGDLGLAPEDLNRHIAYDVGAAGVSEHLGEALNAPVLMSRFSRLVIDPNRGEDDPTILMRLYDGTIVPGNRHADAAERERRLERFYRPYHAAYADLAGRRADTIILAVHSFAWRLNGYPPRPWQVGVLSGRDRRFADPLLDRLRADPALCVGDNEPYGGHLAGDSVDRHAIWSRTAERADRIAQRCDRNARKAAGMGELSRADP